MEYKGGNTVKKAGKRKMTGLIIVLVIVAVLFGIGAIFCAPWSPVHKALIETGSIISVPGLHF